MKSAIINITTTTLENGLKYLLEKISFIELLKSLGLLSVSILK